MMSSRNIAHGTNLLVFLILFYFSNFGIFFALMMGHSTRRPFNWTRLTGHVVNGYGQEY
jgi:NADH:ubiquinone oxidoreductase subunit H